MNEIKIKFLLAGDKFTYRACGTFTKIKERTKKIKETCD